MARRLSASHSDWCVCLWLSSISRKLSHASRHNRPDHLLGGLCGAFINHPDPFSLLAKGRGFSNIVICLSNQRLFRYRTLGRFASFPSRIGHPGVSFIFAAGRHRFHNYRDSHNNCIWVAGLDIAISTHKQHYSTRRVRRLAYRHLHGYLVVSCDYHRLKIRFQREFERAREQAGSALHELQEESKNLELRVQERTDQLAQKSEFLRSSAFIVRNIAESQDVPTLLERAVHWASNLLGFYHVAIYLFDEERRTAFLQAASSDVGKKMMENNFHITSNPKNVIGYVAEQNKAYIITDTNEGNKLRLTPEGTLDQTHSRIAIPLSARGKMIGVLDFQSKDSRAFNQDDLEILQPLADQIAISIESMHLLNDTQALVGELESLTKQQTEYVWKHYLSTRALAYQYTPSEIKLITPGQVRTKDEKEMQIPLRLRGQNIGMIAFHGKEKLEWTESERVLVESVAAQVALALDNSRLIEETRPAGSLNNKP